MRKLSFSGFTLALLLAFGNQSANAALTTYFGEDLGFSEQTPLAAHPNADQAQAAFLANLFDVGTEDFEGLAPGTPSPVGIVFPGTQGDITATLQNTGEVENIAPGTTNGRGRYAISGAQYWETDQAFGVTFSEPVAAFGFYGVDIGDFTGQMTLTLDGAGAQVIVIPHTVNPLGTPPQDRNGGSVLYFGIIEDLTFTSVTFGNTAMGTDSFGFDDMTVGSLDQIMPPPPPPPPPPAVPEPGTMALFGLSLGGIGLVRRRREKKQD